MLVALSFSVVVSCSRFILLLCLVPDSSFCCVLFQIHPSVVSCSRFILLLCLVPDSSFSCVSRFILLLCLVPDSSFCCVLFQIHPSVVSCSRFILLSQPHINNLILTGCIICLCCVFLQGLDGRYVDEDTFVVLCQVCEMMAM